MLRVIFFFFQSDFRLTSISNVIYGNHQFEEEDKTNRIRKKTLERKFCRNFMQFAYILNRQGITIVRTECSFYQNYSCYISFSYLALFNFWSIQTLFLLFCSLSVSPYLCIE